MDFPIRWCHIFDRNFVQNNYFKYFLESCGCVGSFRVLLSMKILLDEKGIPYFVQKWEPMSRCKSFQICSLFGPNSGDRWEPEGAAPRALRISGNFQNSFLNSVKSGPPVGPRRPSGVDPQHSPGPSGGLWSLLRPLAPPVTF